MAILFNDFETSANLDVSEVGADKYSLDSQTYAICWAYALDDGPISVWLPGEPFPIDDIHKHVITAHNAAFEFAIWTNVMVPRYGWPEVTADQFECTAARCAALGLPRALDKAAKAVKLGILKDDDGRRKMLRVSQRRKPTKHNPSTWHWGHSEWSPVIEYCKNDVAVERALHHYTIPLTDNEHGVYLLNERINANGVPIDETLLGKCIEAEQYSKKLAVQELREITKGLPPAERVTSPDQHQRIKAFCGSRGVPLPNTQAATIEYIVEKGGLPDDVDRLLRARQRANKASVKKLAAMKARGVHRDGSLRVLGSHLYHGAGTGRFASRGLQIHNFARGLSGKPADQAEATAIIEDFLGLSAKGFSEKYPDVPSAVKKIVRRSVRAPEGSVLAVVDYAQIEARVAAWYVGDDELLETFRSGEDPYTGLASTIYGYPVTREMKERDLGKAARLGLQFQMGGGRFFDTARDIYNVEGLTQDMADKAVALYRETNPLIPQMWNRLKAQSMDCVEMESTRSIGPKGRFTIDRNWLRLSLPSGRHLNYYDPHIIFRPPPADWDTDAPVQTLAFWGLNQNHQWVKQTTYGGKLFENIVQGIARDLLVYGMQVLEAAGFKIVAHIHDEVILELLKSQIHRFDEICNLMRLVPKWAEGMPVEVEGFCETRYRK